MAHRDERHNFLDFETNILFPEGLKPGRRVIFEDLGLPTCLAALVITAVVSIKTRSNPLALAREISWGTLALVAGLFVMVDAVESIGAMRQTQQWLAWAQKLGPWVGTLTMGFGVGVANNLVNNLPLGLIAGSTLHMPRDSLPALFWSASISDRTCRSQAR